MLPVWKHYENLLPRRPYCANCLTDGLIIRSRDTALTFAHIQHNDPMEIRWIVFDDDHSDAATRWETCRVQAPNFVSINPDNGRGHLGYALRSPITANASNGRAHPMEFVAAIERGMAKLLNSDQGYTRLIAKNAKNNRWRTTWFAPYPYELGELAKDLSQSDMRKPNRIEQISGLGRNSSVFDELREIAYHTIFAHKMEGGNQSSWIARIEKIAFSINIQFSHPLSIAEVRGISKSVARWTWHRMDPTDFSRKQAYIGASATRKNRALVQSLVGSTDKPSIRPVSLRELASLLGTTKKHGQPVSQRTARRVLSEQRTSYLARSVEAQKPWLAEGISRRTWYRKKKKGHR